MARNPWENMDAGMGQGRPGVGFFGWVLRLLVVAGITLAGGFYWPLYRAHKALRSEYDMLSQRTQTVEQELAALRTELGAVKAKRDELEARRGMDQNRERASHELFEQVKSDLTSKLSRQIEKGTMSVVSRQNLVVVRIPVAVAESATRTEVTPEARLGLCALSGATASRGPLDLRVVARDAGGGVADKTHAPWGQAAERAATVARALVEKCRYSAEHVEAAVRPQGKTGEPGAGDPETAVDVEIDPGRGATLTAL